MAKRRIKANGISASRPGIPEKSEANQRARVRKWADQLGYIVGDKGKRYGKY